MTTEKNDIHRISNSILEAFLQLAGLSAVSANWLGMTDLYTKHIQRRARPYMQIGVSESTQVVSSTGSASG